MEWIPVGAGKKELSINASANFFLKLPVERFCQRVQISTGIKVRTCSSYFEFCEIAKMGTLSATQIHRKVSNTSSRIAKDSCS